MAKRAAKEEKASCFKAITQEQLWLLQYFLDNEKEPDKGYVAAIQKAYAEVKGIRPLIEGDPYEIEKNRQRLWGHTKRRIASLISRGFLEEVKVVKIGSSRAKCYGIKEERKEDVRHYLANHPVTFQ